MRFLNDYPPLPVARRVARVLIGLLGVLLIFAGLCLGVLPLMLVLLILVIDPLNGWQAPDLVSLSLVGGATLCLLAGVRISRGRRGLVLFLRRFGFEGASETLSFAVGTAIGQRHRLVTLDDAELAPRGTPPSTRYTVRAVLVLASVAAVVGIALAARWVHGGGMDELVSGLFVDSSAENSAQTIGEAFGRIFVGFLLGIIVIPFVLVLIFMPIAVGAATSLMAWWAARSVRKAEKSRQLTISDANEIDASVEQVVRRARKVLAPRLVVVRCADALWQQVVRRFAAECQIAIIDVSEPSPNVAWEVKAVAELQTRSVFVGRYDKVAWLENASASAEEAVRQLGVLLADADVLVYDTRDRAARRRFARALGACLDHRGARPVRAAL